MHGSFDLRHSAWLSGDADDPTLIRKPDGTVYSVFPLGQSLAQAPGFALARALQGLLDSPRGQRFVQTLGFGVTPALLYGATGGLLFLLLRRRLELSRALSLSGVAIYAFATLAFPFSKYDGVEPLQTCLIVWVVYAVLCPDRWSVAAAAFAFGMLVLAKPPSAVMLPVIAYLFIRNGVWARSTTAPRVAAVAAAVGLAGLFSYYNWIRGGDPLSSYPTRTGLAEFALGNVPGTLWPLLIGPDRNLFLNSPAYLLALPGLLLLRDRGYAIAAGGIWLTFLLIYGASGNKNWGAYVGNARYIVPVLPLLLPYVVATLQGIPRLRPPPLRQAAWLGVAGLLAISVYVQLLFASYSEFHLRHFERRYNNTAESAGVPRLPAAKHPLRFAHHLFWRTSADPTAADLAGFPYPSRDPAAARHATATLHRIARIDHWFRKDYLFLNRSAFPGVAPFAPVRAALLAGALLGLALIALGLRRAAPDVRPGPP